MALVGPLIPGQDRSEAGAPTMYAIGIAGASGVGKSLVALELARLQPGSGVVSMDSYYADLSALPVDERAAVNFDSPEAVDWEMLDMQFRRLRRGERVAVPKYDFSTHTRTGVVQESGPWSVVVLEGLFALWQPRIRSRLDCAVFIDAPEEVCLARRIARDVSLRGRTEASVTDQWLRDVAPMFRTHVLPTREHADLVVDGSRPPAESAAAILREFRNLTEARNPRLSREGSSLHSNR